MAQREPWIVKLDRAAPRLWAGVAGAVALAWILVILKLVIEPARPWLTLAAMIATGLGAYSALVGPAGPRTPRRPRDPAQRAEDFRVFTLIVLGLPIHLDEEKHK